MKKRWKFPIRIGITATILTLTCLVTLVACQQELKQGDSGMLYFFSGEVVEVDDEYLLIEVNDTGNTPFSMDEKVEVSTDVVSAGGCPDIAVGKYARVLMIKNMDNNSTDRLEALSIYEVDETGGIITE